MKHSRFDKYLLFLVTSLILTLNSCRKKDEKYDGTYVGTERIIHSDSNGVYLDSSYNQIVTVEYKNRKYISTQVFNNPDDFSFTDPHSAFKENGSSGFGDCVDDEQGNFNCGSTWRYFYATDSMKIEYVGNTGDTAIYTTFLGKKM